MGVRLPVSHFVPHFDCLSWFNANLLDSLVHKRPEVLQCKNCGMMTPFSQNRGSPLHPTGKHQFGG